ncbi:UNKNOWN [Stylonychia lemnae]|uniref:Uncharacterized protein n=1 Tax=Stylonychia lemnae TaxID=5949 RepID=A0A078ACC5_STYLE|nr:UNKNOWN [Stylonychia lemnae]|eukprot:CDW79247.1 UNKNOWN [Stylonychia lemnae]
MSIISLKLKNDYSADNFITPMASAPILVKENLNELDLPELPNYFKKAETILNAVQQSLNKNSNSKQVIVSRNQDFKTDRMISEQFSRINRNEFDYSLRNNPSMKLPNLRQQARNNTSLETQSNKAKYSIRQQAESDSFDNIFHRQSPFKDPSQRVQSNKNQNNSQSNAYQNEDFFYGLSNPSTMKQNLINQSRNVYDNHNNSYQDVQIQSKNGNLRKRKGLEDYHNQKFIKINELNITSKQNKQKTQNLLDISNDYENYNEREDKMIYNKHYYSLINKYDFGSNLKGTDKIFKIY